MSAEKPRPQILLTQRALRDLAEIEAYTLAEWGKRQADKYIANFEQALNLLQEAPDLLRQETQFSAVLTFYRVGKHYLVCDANPRAIYVLTVIHASRDIPSRLGELAPTLASEIELLRRRLPKRK